MVYIKYKDNLGNFVKLKPIEMAVAYTLNLDANGTFTFSYPLVDPKAAFLTKRREIQIWEDGVMRYQGRIMEAVKVPTSANPMLQVSGEGLFQEFIDEICVPNKLYVNVPYTDLLNPADADTIIRPNTWSTIVEPTSEDFTYLSSLQSSLNMFTVVKQQLGYHFRYIGDAVTPRKLEFGNFGDDSGVRLRSVPVKKHEVTPDYLVFADGGLTVTESSLDVANYIFPIGGGGGNGVNQLTLRDVDPAIIDPAYPILVDPEIPNTDANYDPAVFGNTKTGPNNFEAYYLKDDASITEYGRIKRAVQFDDLYPAPANGTTYSNADRINAANELYKAAVQYLKEHKVQQVSYQVTAYGQADSLNVGDKINLKYKGVVNKLYARDTAKTIWMDIDEDLYVIAMTITWDAIGQKNFQLTLSNVLKLPQDDTEVIAETIESVRNAGRQRKGSVTTYPVYFKDSFDSANPATFLFWIPPETVFTDYINLKVRIRRFRAYSKAVDGGGATTATSSSGGGSTQSSSSGGNHTHNVTIPSHSHQMFTVAPASFPIPGPGQTGIRIVYPAGGINVWGDPSMAGSTGTSSGGGGSVQSSTANGNHSHTVNIPNHTHTVTLPNHTHAIQFGIYEEPTAPTGVAIWIDGVNYASQFGAMSAFNYYPGTGNSTFDLMKFASNLGQLDNLLTPGVHTIEVRCSGGLGQVELSIFNQFYLSSR